MRLLSVFIAVVGVMGCANAETPSQREILKGKRPVITGGDRTIVAQTRSDFESALKLIDRRMSSAQAQTYGGKIDFSAETVLGVLLSNRATSCVDVDIKGVASRDMELVVTYIEVGPDQDSVCLDGVHSAFDFVAIPKTTLKVRFEKSAK